MRRLGSATDPCPADARVLAQSVRRLGAGLWRTTIWRAVDGTFGSTLAGGSGSAPTWSHQEGAVPTLAELDQLVAAEIGRRGPRGPARLALLSAAAHAFTEADRLAS